LNLVVSSDRWHCQLNHFLQYRSPSKLFSWGSATYAQLPFSKAVLFAVRVEYKASLRNFLPRLVAKFRRDFCGRAVIDPFLADKYHSFGKYSSAETRRGVDLAVPPVLNRLFTLFLNPKKQQQEWCSETAEKQTFVKVDLCASNQTDRISKFTTWHRYFF